MTVTNDKPIEIRIGLGSCCQASGSADTYRALMRTIHVMHANVVVREGACVGMCHRVPLVEIIDGESRALYGHVTPRVVPAIMRRHVRPRGLLGHAGSALRWGWDRLTKDEAWESVDKLLIQPDAGQAREFLHPQIRIATADCGVTDPIDISEYRARGGYEALQRVLTLPRADVVEMVRASGLRGRGGAGFPTGVKWATVAAQPAWPKYAVVNGDEGDPGAFMDRMLLEGYPHRILEGLIIGAYAVGASRAFFYIRQEYPLAVQHVQIAIAQANEAGLLGDDIAGSGFSLSVEVRQGSGAFVCGEETALIASIEGKRGMPRLRPPYPAVSGLWGKPTLVSNVETYACVPWIVRNGPERFSAIGTETSRGAKVFALAGKVARGGLIEVPMGITIREIVEGIGGGTKSGRAFKAVQIGGPSGGCIPARLGETPVDYEALIGIGAMMGSGGLVVLDEDDCMVDIARYFLQFTQNESCGKCTYCRIGTKRMLEILNRICNGQGKPQDLDELESLAEQIRLGSLCGLGQTAPNPVLTTLKYFREEYEAHIAGRCPASKCEALIKYHVTDECIGCTKCALVCPADAVLGKPHEKHVIDLNKCTRCHMCVPACPVDAIKWE